MQINVTDIHTSHSVGTYGYCTCGFDRKKVCDQECRYYQTCARNPHKK